MFKNIKHIFKSKDHKEIMLAGLLVSSFVIYIVLALSALYVGLTDVFWIKLSVGFIIGILFFVCTYYKNIPLITILLFIVLEIDTSLAMLSEHLFDFISIYPFFIIFGFFFFFRLKTALWMSFIHFIYWTIATIMRQHEVMDHPKFQVVISDINMLTTSVVVVLLGIFYNISTEVTYEKLEIANEKHEMLLKEIHHRIKNNLNIIASIFGLQILNLKKGVSKSTEEVLKDNKVRIESIAIIHESLYQNNDIGKVPFDEYARNLTKLINKTYNRNISVQIDSDDISLPLEMMFRLGIILNELFTNSIKYAFEHDAQKDQVWIALSKDKDKYHFVYHESRNENIDIKKMLSAKTLGMRLIQLTVKQMDGTLDIAHNNGLIFTIKF
jgi:two-component sensor histidine kinase